MRIVFWAIGVYIVNGWLLCRKHQRQRSLHCEYSLLKFQINIPTSLCTNGKVQSKKRVRPTADSLVPKKNPNQIHPVEDVRYDQMSH